MDNQNDVLYLKAIVSPLLHGEARIERSTDERGVLLTMFMSDKSDIGRIIGKKGATIHAVRRLMKQYGAACDSRISIKIYEPDNPDKLEGASQDGMNIMDPLSV